MNNRKMTVEEKFTIEAIINEVGLVNFMEGVSDVAMSKAESVQANRTDRLVSRAWYRCGVYLQTVAKSQFVKLDGY
jgi:hypothetical protein